MNYFNFIPVELIEYIASNLEDFDDIGDILSLNNINYANIFRLVYPYMYSQIKFILEVNTKLHFNLYNNEDVSIFKKIYFDLIYIYQFEVTDDDDGIQSLTNEYLTTNFSEINNICSMIVLYKKYPHVYPYVKKYLKWNFGPFVFMFVITRGDRYILDTAFKDFILGKKSETPIIIDNIDFSDVAILNVLFMIDLMKNIYPKDIMITENFLKNLSAFEDEIYNDDHEENMHPHTFAEYERYSSLYDHIISQLLK